MADFPVDNVAAPPFLHTFSQYCSVYEIANTTGTLAATAQTWGIANAAKFYPITIPFHYNVRRAFWVNGSTITTTSADFGIYTKGGQRIYSTGLTALGTASAPQFFTPASPIRLTPGDYYFAFVCNSASTSRVTGNATAALGQRLAGIMESLATGTLPASVTFTAVTSGTINMCGVTWTDSGF